MVTGSLQHHYKQTTQWRIQYTTEKYNQNKQKQWTCNSIGSETYNAKNNSEYIGNQANQTMQTTGKSTIQKPTTKPQEKIPNNTHHIVNSATRTATT